MNHLVVKKSGTDKLVLYKNGNKIATASYEKREKPKSWMPVGYFTTIDKLGVKKYKGTVGSIAEIKMKLIKVGR